MQKDAANHNIIHKYQSSYIKNLYDNQDKQLSSKFKKLDMPPKSINTTNQVNMPQKINKKRGRI